MRRWLALIVVLACLGAHVSSWEWPADPYTVSALFGQSRRGTFSRGIEFDSGVGPVYPVADGVVVFRKEAGSGIRTQTGTTVIVEHPRGFRSIYSNLDPGTTPAVGMAVEADTKLGAVGGSGNTALASPAGRREWQLLIYDTEAGAYVNPMLLLPAVDDDVPPIIESVYLQDDEALFDLRLESQIPAGTYELLVGCGDRLTTNGPSVAPYSVAILTNGMELSSVEHDELIVEKGEPRLMSASTLSHEQARTENGEYIAGGAQLPPGRAVLEIIVTDFAGNVTSLVRELEVVR